MISFLINVFILIAVCGISLLAVTLIHEFLFPDSPKAAIWVEPVTGSVYTLFFLMLVYYGFHYLFDIYFDRNYFVDFPLIATLAAVMALVELAITKANPGVSENPVRAEIVKTFHWSLIIIVAIAACFGVAQMMIG